MPRSFRQMVFLNESELDTFRAVCPDDEPIGRVIRRMALERARWLQDHGKKHRVKLPCEDSDSTSEPRESRRYESSDSNVPTSWD